MSVDITLIDYLNTLQISRKPYNECLSIAIDFVTSLGGHVVNADEEGVTVLTLRNTIAYCFQPYPDIDLFYFES